jgi:prophage regulatory protein
MNQRLIRLPQVKAMVGLGRSSIYDRMKRGEFPIPIKVGRVSGWIEAEVQVWISERIQASRPEQVKALPNSCVSLPTCSRGLARGPCRTPALPHQAPD